MTQETKPFEYMELKAMLMICSAYSFLYAINGELTDESTTRKHLEDEVERIVNIRWNDPEKKSL